MNQQVTVSGMKVTTQVSSNLQIASSAAGTTTAGEAAFKNSLQQDITGVLEPVSTVNGVNFFYTTNGKADGDSETDDYKAYDETAFRSDYGVPSAVGYIDYVFELKAINTDTSNAKYIDLTKLDLIYTGTADDTSKAHRVAMFVQNADTFGTDGVTVATYAAFPSTAKCIFDVTGSANQTADYAVSVAATAPTAISIMATKALASIEVAKNSTKYFKVTLRLYLEGEDKTCTNATFLPLTSAWNLDVIFALAANTDSSVTEISKYAAQTIALNTVNTLVYWDGTNLYNANNMTKLNSGAGVVPTTLCSAAELEALNTAFGSSFAFPA